jgi:aryl-alcohol dehydrogenase-like predicted oxidoreductase
MDPPIAIPYTRAAKTVMASSADPAATDALRKRLTRVADDAGVSMIELAIAFVVNHRGVTSAIAKPA